MNFAIMACKKNHFVSFHCLIKSQLKENRRCVKSINIIQKHNILTNKLILSYQCENTCVFDQQ